MTDSVQQIGMAQLTVERAPMLIRSSGLGSCLGVIIYDPFTATGAMAHAMLPYYRQGRQGNKAKYVDTAIEVILAEMKDRGCKKENLIAKLAGGAQMFPDADRDVLVIGKKNIQAGRECLAELGIPIVAEDVGGNSGRSLEFDCATGDLTIKTITNKTII
ncbi:MAG: chemotaxis protein CheD [Firmicutes bacterium]|nr:chemotaxis protein CheD [Bacillota bacterium]